MGRSALFADLFVADDDVAQKRKASLMRLNDLIKRPVVTCAVTSTIADAARTMHLKEVGSLVVVDDVGGVVGLVTDRDLAVRGYGRELDPSTGVEVVMTRAPHTIRCDADSKDAIAKMMAYSVRRLPMVDEQGKLCGVVTMDDLAMLVEEEGESLREAVRGQVVPDAPSWSRGWDA